MNYRTYFVDAFAWLEARDANSIHAIVTDPPYGLKEYTDVEKAKLRNGRGGVWRIPPSFDGCKRSPLPRFTVLDETDILALRSFFTNFAVQAMRVLVPGGHIMIATNPLLSHYVYLPIMSAGFEKRGEIIRLIQTLRGGDRPKNAHEEFRDVSVMPRSGWEPWGLFRKPCEGRVQDNLRKWGTGGLRRVSGKNPFLDAIQSAPARPEERKIAPHPSLKPQAFMRQLVRAALPLGRGVILDPFMGSGSTIAAAEAVGYSSIGIEKDPAYYSVAAKSIPALARFTPNGNCGAHLPLPKDLKPIHIKRAVTYVEKQTADLIDLYLEQANVFSAIIGIFGVKALHAVSPYKKHKHPDVAQQRFPDLSLNGRLDPPPTQALESKGSTRPWAIQSHYNHSGWYVVWRCLVDTTESIKPGHPVVIWRVDVVFLTADDWKYEGSGAKQGRGGRTHTFGVSNPAKKLIVAAAYALPGIIVKNGKPVLSES